MDKCYYDEKGNYIEEYSDGWLFINGMCVNEPMTDAESDRFAVEVINGDGYYNENGKFIRYPIDL